MLRQAQHDTGRTLLRKNKQPCQSSQSFCSDNFDKVLMSDRYNPPSVYPPMLRPAKHTVGKLKRSERLGSYLNSP